MSLFSQEIFIRELRALLPTQEKIKTLALYMKALSSDSTQMMRIIDKEYSESNAYHKINIFYLANEVISTTKKNDKDSMLLLEQIKSFVLANYSDLWRDTVKFSVLRGKLTELKKVWLEKKIFTKEDFDDSAFSSVTSDRPTKEEKKFSYSKEEVIEQIEKFYDCKEALANYLDEMVKRLRKN